MTEKEHIDKARANYQEAYPDRSFKESEFNEWLYGDIDPERDEFYGSYDAGGTGHGDISYSDADPGL